MIEVFWRTLKVRRVSLIIYCFAVVAFLLLYISIFPTIQQQSANFSKLLEAYPQQLMKAFNVDLNNYLTIGGYISSELFSLIWPILVIVIMSGYAGGTIAGEIDRGTIKLLLAQPLSRMQILGGKYLTAVAMLIIFVIFSTFSAIPILAAFNIGFSAISFVYMAIACFLFGISIFSIAFFFSSILSDSGKVSFITAGLIIVMYVLNIIASLKTNLSDLKYASFFHYFNSNDALIAHKIDPVAIYVFLAVTVIFSVLAFVCFQKRNITA